MVICIPTMMHSGTHILRYCVLREKYKGSDGLFNTGAHAAYHWHLDKMYDKHYPLIEKYPAFTSLRHPYRIWQSYLIRQYKNHENRSWPRFIKQWRVLIDTIDKYNPMYLHVDVPEIRDQQIEAMSEKLGLELKFNWRELTPRTGSHYGTHNCEIKNDIEIPQEFIDFYYEKMQ